VLTRFVDFESWGDERDPSIPMDAEPGTVMLFGHQAL
jgi:hypothetical protein